MMDGGAIDTVGRDSNIHHGPGARSGKAPQFERFGIVLSPRERQRVYDAFAP